MKMPQPPMGLAPGECESVDALMSREGIPKEIKDRVEQLEGETQITLLLAKIRQRAGITQAAMAKELNVVQGTISKWEGGKDEELTLGVIKEYVRVTGVRIGLSCGKPMTHAEAVTAHASGLKHHLEALAEQGSQNEQSRSKINGFFAEVFRNLFNIMALCSNKLSKEEKEVEIRSEVVQCEQAATLPEKSEAVA